ncbi:ABC transporter permease [Mucilaginibacter sp. HMF5004]|uniref:ABC transporter permease n=1 Tax=Mucilaginibacter rivuli TaxID=2857527 RepID=UPI001C603E19|nr:FtsX-like permease family protein [Mucilaginibacter rivuli]MBW4891446.1 ABC transporter permease [Mucilaginibacter rivuli]
MNFASFIASRISFRSKRTFSKLIVRIAVAGIMLGLGVMVLSFAIMKGFKQEVREKIRGFSGDIQVLKLDLNTSYENSPVADSPAFVAQLKAKKLYTHIMPFATIPCIIKANDEIEGVVMKGVNRDYDWAFFNKIMVAGKVPDFRDTVASQKQIMISQHTADRLKLKVGDDFLMYFIKESLHKRKFKITGIFTTGIEEVDKTFVVGDINLIRKINHWPPDYIGGYEIQVKQFEDIDAANAAMADVIPTTLKTFTVMESFAQIFDWLTKIDINTQIMLVLMLIVAVINMISAMLIMILERTAMIGMLKAMGARTQTIQQIFLINAFYLISLGLILGNAFGLGIAYLQQQSHWIKLDQESYYMKYVPIKVEWLDVVELNLGTLVISLIVLIGPSLLVSRILPVKAIQFK